MLKIFQKNKPPLNLSMLLIFTSIPTLCYYFKYISKTTSIEDKLYGVFLLVSIVSQSFIWAMLIKKNKILSLLCITISIIICILDICCLYYYNSVFNTIFLELIAETNIREAKEFLLSNNVVLISIACFIAFVILKKLLNYINAFVPISVLLVSSFLVTITPVVVFFFSDSIINFPLSRSINIMAEYIECRNKVKHFTNNLNIETEILQNQSTIPNVIFVLGESATKTHMSLYDYEKETNPLLKDRDLFVYQNVTSPDTVTMGSIKQIFTYYNRESDKEWFEYPNMFDILNKAGYKTFWLSNQERIGYFANVQEALSSRCDVSEYLVKTTDLNPQNYDEKLLPLLDKYQTDEKSFYLIHLAGSHCIYKNRYPKNFTKYEGLIGEYDNSILYTDYVIDEIIKKFEDKNAIVIYLSDHGEEVSEKEKCGHYPNGGDAQKQIPMLIWISDQFRQSYPDKVLQLQKNIYTPINTGDIIHGLLNLLDIKTKDYKKDKDIFAM